MIKKLTFMIIIFFFIMLYCTHYLIEANKKAMNTERRRQEKQNQNLGKRVIIDNDTLTIININFWNEYVLSNGKKVSGNYKFKYL